MVYFRKVRIQFDATTKVAFGGGPVAVVRQLDSGQRVISLGQRVV